MQLIKFDQSPSASAEGSPDVLDSGPGNHGLFSKSPERASDSSNFSESLNSDQSPEHDLSPFVRRRGRLNRAHRQRIVRSEYFTPEMADSLAIQGRSRSLDSREFVRELMQSETPVASPGHISSCSSLSVLPNPSPSDSGDSGQEKKHSNDVSRTLSFSHARDDGQDSPIQAGAKSTESKVRKPPDYKSLKVNGENSSFTKKKTGGGKVETKISTPENSPLIKERSGNYKVEPRQLTEANGNSLPKKKGPHTKVEIGKILEENFPHTKNKSVDSKLKTTPENSPAWKKSVNNNVEASPELPTLEDRLSISSHHDDSSCGSRRVSESSQKSSDVSSKNSRTSSFTGSDVVKTPSVRHVGSAPSTSGGERVEKRQGVNTALSKDKDELQVSIGLKNIEVRKFISMAVKTSRSK